MKNLNPVYFATRIDLGFNMDDIPDSFCVFVYEIKNNKLTKIESFPIGKYDCVLTQIIEKYPNRKPVELD